MNTIFLDLVLLNKLVLSISSKRFLCAIIEVFLGSNFSSSDPLSIDTLRSSSEASLSLNLFLFLIIIFKKYVLE